MFKLVIFTTLFAVNYAKPSPHLLEHSLLGGLLEKRGHRLAGLLGHHHHGTHLEEGFGHVGAAIPQLGGDLIPLGQEAIYLGGSGPLPVEKKHGGRLLERIKERLGHIRHKLYDVGLGFNGGYMGYPIIYPGYIPNYLPYQLGQYGIGTELEGVGPTGLGGVGQIGLEQVGVGGVGQVGIEGVGQLGVGAVPFGGVGGVGGVGQLGVGAVPFGGVGGVGGVGQLGVGAVPFGGVVGVGGVGQVGVGGVPFGGVGGVGGVGQVGVGGVPFGGVGGVGHELPTVVVEKKEKYLREY